MHTSETQSVRRFIAIADRKTSSGGRRVFVWPTITSSRGKAGLSLTSPNHVGTLLVRASLSVSAHPDWQWKDAGILGFDVVLTSIRPITVESVSSKRTTSASTDGAKWR